MEDYIEIRYLDTNDSETQSTASRVEEHTKSGKVTDNVLTQYEYARLVGGLAKMIAAGYPPLVEWEKGSFDPIAIAKRQIEQRVGSIVIVRKIPDSKDPRGYHEELWDLKHMNIRDC